MSFYERRFGVTKHAIQRFMERSNKEMTPFQAECEILRLIDTAFETKINDNEYHYEIPYKEMIFIVRNNSILTFKWKGKYQ